MRAGTHAKPSRLLLLKDIARKPSLASLFVAGSILYYLFIRYIITISSQGVFLITMPLYLLYAVSISSALLLTVSAYSMRLSYAHGLMGISDGTASAATTVVGSLVTSCGCSAPVLGTILYLLGANAIGVSGAIAFIATNQEWLMAAVILANLLLAYYSLGRLTYGCVLDSSGKVKAKKTR